MCAAVVSEARRTAVICAGMTPEKRIAEKLNVGINKQKKGEKLVEKRSVGEELKKVKKPWLIRVQHRNPPVIMCPPSGLARNSDAIFAAHGVLWCRIFLDEAMARSLNLVWRRSHDC